MVNLIIEFQICFCRMSYTTCFGVKTPSSGVQCTHPNPHIWIYNNKSGTVWRCIYHFVFRLAMCKSKTNKTLKQQKLYALYSLRKVEIELSLTSVGQWKRSFSMSTGSQLFWSSQYYACRVGRASLTNDLPMLVKKQWISEGVEHRNSSTTDMFPGRGISHFGD